MLLMKNVSAVCQAARIGGHLHHLLQQQQLTHVLKPVTINYCGLVAASPARGIHSSVFRCQGDSSTYRPTPIPEGILLGLGNPLLDICIQGNQQLLDKYNLKPDNSILAEDIHDGLFEEMVENYKPEFEPGGATQNTIRVAQWLLRSPKSTVFIGAVGGDNYGKILKDISEKVGVEVIYEVLEGESTGVCGAVMTDVHRSLVTKLGAAKLLDLDFVRRPNVWKYVERARYFYIGGYVLPVCPEAIKNIVHHASVNDKTVAMNLHATYLCKHFLREDLNLMHYIDILFGNGQEARKLAEEAGLNTQDLGEIALKISQLPKANAKKRSRIVVFTDGRKPMYVAQNGKVTEYPVVALDPAVIKDTNGCGDAFTGGFLSQLIQGKSIEECMDCSIYASKVVAQNYGCSFPDKPDYN